MPNRNPTGGSSFSSERSRSRIRRIALAAASRSPSVVAPLWSASIRRSFSSKASSSKNGTARSTAESDPPRKTEVGLARGGSSG